MSRHYTIGVVKMASMCSLKFNCGKEMKYKMILFLQKNVFRIITMSEKVWEIGMLTQS